MFGFILSLMGAIASLISLVFTLINQKKSWAITIAIFIILLLTGTSSYYSYNYYQITNSENVRSKQMENLQKAAKEFITEYPSFRDFWDEGENEGIAKSGLIILEMYKDLYPDNYEMIKKDIEKDIDYSKENRENTEQHRALESVAQMTYTTMRTLSKIH